MGGIKGIGRENSKTDGERLVRVRQIARERGKDTIIYTYT